MLVQSADASKNPAVANSAKHPAESKQENQTEFLNPLHEQLKRSCNVDNVDFGIKKPKMSLLEASKAAQLASSILFKRILPRETIVKNFDSKGDGNNETRVEVCLATVNPPRTNHIVAKENTAVPKAHLPCNLSLTECVKKTDSITLDASNPSSLLEDKSSSCIANGILFCKEPTGEMCNVCGSLGNVQNMDERWIFCISCGDAFHLECAADAPSLHHPIQTDPWYWQCSNCRRCDQCKKGFGRSLCCFTCRKNYCTRCDKRVASSEHGFYFRCRKCREAKTQTCLNCHCSISNNQKETLIFCTKCKKKGACPKCKVRYSNYDWDVMMVGCIECDSWTHAECLGLTKSEYEKMGESDVPYYCLDCQRKKKTINVRFCRICGKNLAGPSENVDLLNDNETYASHAGCRKPCKGKRNALSITRWLVKGSTTVEIARWSRGRYLKVSKYFWSPFRIGMRAKIGFDIRYDQEWEFKSVEVSIEGTFLCKVKSLLEACDKLKKHYLKTSACILNLDKVDWSRFLRQELLDSVTRYLKLCYVGPKPRLPDANDTSTSTPALLKSSALVETPKNILKSNSEYSSARTREYSRPRRKADVFFIETPYIAPLSLLITSINKTRMADTLLLRVTKSRIAGYGLFTDRNISVNTRIIEYTGEIIGQLMADRREALYNLQSLRRWDCYLFRLSFDKIIDATLKANVARFINHSCKPNCESRIEKGCIVIYAIQNILAGEELTYDYKFSKEDHDDEVPCACGTTKCRGIMN